MKILSSPLPRYFLTLLTVGASCIYASAAETADPLSYEVPIELGTTQFLPGDGITIQQVRGTSATIQVGGTYSVDGTYTLGSKNEATLGFHSTITSPKPTPTDAKQILQIKKGSGSFHLVKTIHEDGYLHISFYSGSSFGGVYFGQGDLVLRTRLTEASTHSGRGRDRFSPPTGANQALFEYLGQPVPPPANLDARYTKDGLLKALQSAASNAGITLKKVVVNDSEYPFLVGVICGGGDYAKLKTQIKKLDGYSYSGSVGNDDNSDGSDTCNALNMIPYEAYPRETDQAIHHRLTLRLQVFQSQLSDLR